MNEGATPSIPKIVGLHGINCFVPPSPGFATSHHSAAWNAALAGNLQTDNDALVNVAYYAHLLRGPIAQGPITSDSASVALLEDWRRDSEFAFQPMGPATHWLRALATFAAPRIDAMFTPRQVESLMRYGAAEAARYFSEQSVRRQVWELVSSTLDEHRPSVVIAHSLGSVVAYEVLHQHPEIEVDLLLTLGSPLAMPHVITPRIQPPFTSGKGVRPPGVGRWINISDPGDLVASVQNLQNYYDGVEADLHPYIGAFACHSVTKYLSSKEVSEAIRPYVDQLAF